MNLSPIEWWLVAIAVVALVVALVALTLKSQTKLVIFGIALAVVLVATFACTMSMSMQPTPEEEKNALDCSDESPNAVNGNICRVPMGDGTYCVAVLPDGKSDRDTDNIRCPKGDEAEAAEVVKKES